MSPLQSDTAAVLVLFAERPLESLPLAGLAGLVGAVVVVDNHACARDDLADRCRVAGAACLHNGNRGKLAGAYNRALQWLQQHRPATRKVLFLDEDSDPNRLAAFLQDPRTAGALAEPDVAAISAAYRDRGTGLRGAYLQLSRWRTHYLPREFPGVREVALLINSMSLWKLDALQRIGPFDEQLALDAIDTDLCIRARRLGLRLMVHGDHEFGHAIGARRRFSLFGRDMQSSGHSPARRWMIARNNVWLARREWRREPGFALLCLQRLAYEAVGILATETRRAPMLWALCRGALAGLRRGPLR